MSAKWLCAGRLRLSGFMSMELIFVDLVFKNSFPVIHNLPSPSMTHAQRTPFRVSKLYRKNWVNLQNWIMKRNWTKCLNLRVPSPFKPILCPQSQLSTHSHGIRINNTRPISTLNHLFVLDPSYLNRTMSTQFNFHKSLENFRWFAVRFNNIANDVISFDIGNDTMKAVT